MFAHRQTRSVVASAAPHATAVVHSELQYPWILAATAVYGSIASILLLRLLVSLVRLNRVVDDSELILDRDLHEMAHEIWLQSLSRYRPRIRTSSEIRVPMAIGIEETTILLPPDWTRWNREKLRAVLIHEIAHVRRADPQTAFLASFTACIFWPSPLVYWLRRRLAALAEEACDAIALLEFRPEQYAQILIEFATERGPKPGRLVAASSVAAHRSRMRRRLKHILSHRRQTQGRQPLLRAALLTAFVPGLYLAATARFDQGKPTTEADQATVISVGTERQANELESQLRRDPEDLSSRGALMAFYANEGNESALTPHLLWVINHRPEAPISTVQANGRRNSPLPLLDDERVRKAWDNALGKQPNSADVAFHAGLFTARNNPQRALELFARATALAPSDSEAQADYLRAIAAIYARAVIKDKNTGNPSARADGIAMDESFARKLHSAVGLSNDPALLCSVGTAVVQAGEDEEGLSLITKAIDLDPANQNWREMLDSAKAEPTRRQNLQALSKGQAAR
jgi:beta-lactamase regulating signal transducer with metallopeptidase domain